MNIKWVGAHENNFSKNSRKPVDRIVMHWIVGNLASADATFNNPNRKASAHYGIEGSTIHQYVKEEDTAWHAGDWAMNQRSIGIEHSGGELLDNATRRKPSEQTHKTSAALVRDICTRYNIPIDKNHIIAHRDVSSTQCPGTLDIDYIIKLASKTDSTLDPTKSLPDNFYDPEVVKEFGEAQATWKYEPSKGDAWDTTLGKANKTVAWHINNYETNVTEVAEKNTKLTKSKQELTAQNETLDKRATKAEKRVQELEKKLQSYTNSMESKRFQLNQQDLDKWLKNTAIFVAPVILAGLMALQGQISQQTTWGVVGLFLVNIFIDLVRKYIKDNTN